MDGPDRGLARRQRRLGAGAVAMVLAVSTGVGVSAQGSPTPSRAPRLDAVEATEAQVFVPMSPVRVLDTRPEPSGPIGVASAAPLGPRQTLTLDLAGPGKPLPESATAALLNVTLPSEATAKSFVTIWPTGEPRPNASANNAEPSMIAANSFTAKLGTGGSIDIYNDAGSVEVVIDLVGFMTSVSDVSGIAGESGPQGPAGPEGPQGPAGADGTDGLDGAGVEVAVSTPLTGAVCGPDGLVSINTATGELSICDVGTWNAPVSVRDVIADSVDALDSGPLPISIDLGNAFTTIASYTAPAAGTYLLEGNVTVRQEDVVLVLAVMSNHECAWFDATNTTQLGPLSASSLLAQLSLGTPVQATLHPTASHTFAAGETANLRCRFTGTSLGLGGFVANGWSFTATRTA